MGIFPKTQGFKDEYEEKDVKEIERKPERRNETILFGDAEAWECL